MWVEFIRKNVAEPLFRRLGTAAAAAILAGGEVLCQTKGVCFNVTQGGVVLAVEWVVAALLIGVDLLLSWAARQKGGK